MANVWLSAEDEAAIVARDALREEHGGNIPVGLRKPWRWVQPASREELIQRLWEAREYAVPERERENLCSCAYEELRKG